MGDTDGERARDRPFPVLGEQCHSYHSTEGAEADLGGDGAPRNHTASDMVLEAMSDCRSVVSYLRQLMLYWWLSLDPLRDLR